MSFRKPGIGSDCLGRNAEGITRVTLFEHVGLTAVISLHTGLTVTAQIKPAVAFESKFTGTLLKYLIKHIGVVRCFDSGCLGSTAIGVTDSIYLFGVLTRIVVRDAMRLRQR